MAISVEERSMGRQTTRLAIRDLLTTPAQQYTDRAQQPQQKPRPQVVTYNSAHPNAWNGLPREFIQNITDSIYKNLGYLDLCRIASVSSVFAETATAYKDEVPQLVKQTAVMEAENYFFQHHKKAPKRADNGPKSTGSRSSKQGTPESPSAESPGPSTSADLGSTPNYACYECCRLIPQSSFARDQPLWIIRHADGRMSHVEGAIPMPGDRRESPRRFCVTCGVSQGFYRSGDQITTLSGQKLWLCGCLVIHIKQDSLTSHMCNRCGERCLHSAPRRPSGPVRVRRPSARTGPY